jgi:hypothetical protein
MCTKSGAGLALEAMRLVPQSVGLARLAPEVVEIPKILTKTSVVVADEKNTQNTLVCGMQAAGMWHVACGLLLYEVVRLFFNQISIWRHCRCV